MICPLMSRPAFLTLPEGCGQEAMFLECQEGNCAWWVPEAKACAVKVLATEQVVYQLKGPVGDLPGKGLALSEPQSAPEPQVRPVLLAPPNEGARPAREEPETSPCVG